MPSARRHGSRHDTRKHAKSDHANPSGVHFLSPDVARRLVRSCSPRPGELVLEPGAGLGAITAPLAATGARVLAVERDAEFVRRLGNRLAGSPNVRIIHGDVRTTPLPRKDFVAIGSIPYAVSTALLRRLLADDTRLDRAALVVEWGFAKRLTATVPRTREVAGWAARFRIELVRRVPARCFRPAPAVDSAQLLITRRAGLDGRAIALLGALLDAAYHAPHRPVRKLLHQFGHHPGGLPRHHGIELGTRAGDLPPGRWALLVRELSGK